MRQHSLLIILLLAFFLKGVLLATLFPLFTGQDEARHYNTLQYLNEVQHPSEHATSRPYVYDKESFSEYNFSDEVLHAGISAGVDTLRNGLFNTQNFSHGTTIGIGELDILSRNHPPENLFLPADTAGGERAGLYHKVAALIEHVLSDQDILVRFFSIRIFSVLLGTIGILFTFLLARTIGFSIFESTLFSACVAFQPKYAMYTTNINYDTLLMPLFFLFAWGGAMSLRDGFTIRSFSIMAMASMLALMTKGTGIVLLVLLFGIGICHVYMRVQNRKKFIVWISMLLIGSILTAFALNTRHPLSGLLPLEGSPSKIASSLIEYLDESLSIGRFALSSRTYWGSLGWNEGIITQHFTDAVWTLEWIAAIGIILLLFTRNRPSFLPEKKYVWFLIAIVAVLQVGIRAADWNVFARLGSLDLGTPGRYFLPSLPAHLMLIATGFGMLAGRRSSFRNILVGGVILMFFFSFYITTAVILPRFYL